MKKFFGLGSKKSHVRLGFDYHWERYCKRGGRKINSIDNSLPGYHIRDRDLGKIHKAASVGNVAKVQQILFFGKYCLNDRDKKHRVGRFGLPDIKMYLTFPESIRFLAAEKADKGVVQNRK